MNWAEKTSNKVDLPLLPLKAIKNETLHKFANLKLSSLGDIASLELLNQYSEAFVGGEGAFPF